jgi:hypothetical protein
MLVNIKPRMTVIKSKYVLKIKKKFGKNQIQRKIGGTGVLLEGQLCCTSREAKHSEDADSTCSSTQNLYSPD